MTIASAIINAKNKIANIYSSLANKGAILPVIQNLTNIPPVINQFSIAYSNFLLYGNLSVNTTTGIVSDFSNNSNYLKLPTVFDPAGLPWEVSMKFTTVNDTTTKQVLFHSSPETDRYGIVFQISGASGDGLFQLDIGDSSSSWLWYASGTHSIQPNTTYYVKFGWTGTEYYMDYSFDGETYTRDISGTKSLPVRTPLNATYIGIYNYSSSNKNDAMKGSIDLSQSYAKINEELVWTALAIGR